MRRVALIALCLCVAVPVAPALAKKKHKKSKGLGPVVTATATGNTATADGQESTATATCPAGKQAVGGGFSAPLAPGSAIVVHDSYRSAPGAWTAAGQQADGAGAVTAFAYCRDASGRPIADVSASTTLNDSGEIKTLMASCPAGTRLIGGGFQSTVPPAGDAVVFPQVNQATSPITWAVTGVANQDGARTLTAHAYCMAKIKAPAIVAQAASGSAAQFGTVTSTSPTCPVPKKPKGKKRKKKPKKLISAGGFSSTINGSPGAPAMVFGESHIGASGGWFAGAANAFATPGVVSVTAQGICF